MREVRAVGGPADTVPLDPVRLAEQRARDLLKGEDIRAAREVVEQALENVPGRSDLLWVLADVEFADGDPEAGVQCLAEAVNADGGEAAAISKQIRVLSGNHLWRKALETIDHVSGQVRDDLQVRTEIGNFYKARGCYGHAVSGYGDTAGLSFSTKERRCLSWLFSGGPFAFARRGVNVWEDSKILSELRRDQPAHGQLDVVPGLDRRRTYILKVRLENAIYEWSLRYERWSAIFRWQLRLLPVACLPVWLVLYGIVSTLGFLSGPPGAVGGTAVSAIIAVGIPLLLVRIKIRGDLSVRGGFSRLSLASLLFACFLSILLEIFAAEGYDSISLPTIGWSAWLFFGLLVFPAVFVCMFGSGAIMAQFGTRSINNVWRRYCSIMLLGMLSWMLEDLQSRSHQLDLTRRVALSRSLEWGARMFSHEFFQSAFLKGVTSGDWLKRRAAGWAEALTYMQREVIAPVPGGQPRLEAKLRHEIQCLATGNLGALVWRQPRPSPSRRTILARNTIQILRTVLVAALPIGAVLVGQAVLHFTSDVFRWASIVTGLWALLYVIISLDPAIRDKIDTARSLVDTLHETRRG